MRYHVERRRGAIAALIAVSLVGLIGVAAIAIDGGMLLDDHRHVQAAADAAALAAAADLWTNYTANNGTDPSGTAKASALATAAANGFNNDGVTSIVTVNIPPQSGNFAGKAGFAEVIIQFNQPRGFSTIFGAGALPVTGRAVAKGIPGDIGILVLDPHLKDACEIDGNVNIQNGGQVFSNSDNTVANDFPFSGSIYIASTATIRCAGLNFVSSLVNNGTVIYTNGGGASSYTALVVDPLANIPEPTTTGLPNYGSVTVNSDTTLQPGVYTNITIGGGGNSPTVTLAPGIYYLANGGSLQFNAGSLQGTGVMIFDATGGDQVFNPAGGTINLRPPTASTGGTWPTGTTSATYSGISFWVPRSQTNEVHVESGYNLTMPGTWYAQGGEFDIRPNGASTVFNIGNYICDQAEWGQGYNSSANKSNGTINMNPTTAVANLRPTLVE